MSIVEPDRNLTRKFLTVRCPCGRELRAPVAMAGQEISCWECHRMVPVPVPRSPERAYRAIREGLPEVFELPWLLALCLGAAVLTAVLCVPGIGVPLSILVLFLGALGYGELIRQCGIDYWDFDDWKRPGPLLARVGVALLFALGVAAPLLLSPRGSGHAPRFTTFGLLLALLGSGVLPLAMFLTYARNDRGPLGWRRGGSLLLRYPLATFLALLIVPLGVVVAEGFATLFMVWQGDFRFLLLELFPGSEYYAGQYKIEPFGNYTRPYLPDPRFYHLYFRRLHQGYAFVSALPASLSSKTYVMTEPLDPRADRRGVSADAGEAYPGGHADPLALPGAAGALAGRNLDPGIEAAGGRWKRRPGRPLVAQGFRRPFASARAVRGSSGQECLG